MERCYKLQIKCDNSFIEVLIRAIYIILEKQIKTISKKFGEYENYIQL